MARTKVGKKGSKGREGRDGGDGAGARGGRAGGAGAVLGATRAVEALGVGLLVVALLLCFALFSFDPSDGHGKTNLVGPLGVRLAGAVLGAVGAIGYVAALLLVGVAGAVIVGWRLRPSPVTVLSGLAVLVSLTVLAHLLASDAVLLGHSTGGALGAVLGEMLRAIVGRAGSAVVAGGLLLIGVLGLTDLSLGEALREAAALARATVLWVQGHVRAAKEARRIAAQREAELVEAERSRRAQAKLEQEERERKLRDALEEKKRLAVLKATARAEERAAAKIAALEAKERLAKAQAERDAEAAAALDGDLVGGIGNGEQASEPPPGSWFEAVEPAEPVEPVEQVEPGITPGIPGQGAEPPLTDDALASAADVLEAIAGDGGVTKRRRGGSPAGDGPVSRADEAGAPADLVDDADGAESSLGVEDGGLEPAGGEGAAGADGEITIHARKHIDTDPAVLEDEAATSEPPALVIERPVVQERRTYHMPALQLLDYEGKPPAPVDGEALRSRATRLEEKLRTYGVEGRVTAIRPGPVVTTYEYQPAPGVKVAKIASLSDDIAMSMEAMRVRIVAPIPGRGVVGIELPNEVRESVYLKELIAHDSFKRSRSLLTLALGKDAEGEPQVRDLRTMPHLLIAGTTGSGKSVSVNAMVLSILYKATPDQVKFIMVDPKMLELSLYEDIPHLLLPVVTDPRKASLALQWAVDEMERRYQMLSDLRVKDIDGFNRRLERLRLQREVDRARRALEAEADEAAALLEAELEAEGGGGATGGAAGPEAAAALEGRAIESGASAAPEPGATSGLEARDEAESSLVPAGAGPGEAGPLNSTEPEPAGAPGPESRRPSEVAAAERSARPAAGKAEPPEGARIRDPWPGQELPGALPYIVVLIDEFADLMCVAPRDVEASVQRLAQKARAAGIHLMLATQRPSTDVITGVIKNNFPTRISFRVASRHDSATILNAPGAENLLGMGDMLCLGVTAPAPVRIHGAFVSEEEVQRVVDFWKAQAKPTFDATILQKRDSDGEDGEDGGQEHDEMYDRAVQIVTETRKASISALQRRLRVGYNRAARMIEMMEAEGLVGPASGPKGEREVLVRAIGPDGPARV